MGRPIVVSVPLGQDYRIDARLKETIDYWEHSIDKVEIYHPISASPEAGRDMTVSYAKYRIPKPTHILFLDSDILPRKAAFEKLLKMDKDIVMGVYNIAQNGYLKWSVSREEPYELLGLEELPRNPFKIKSGGFGVTLIKYEVFETLEWPYWKNVYVPGNIQTGEDIYFCRKVIEAGYDIWCEPVVKCSHIRIANLLNIAMNIMKNERIKQ